MQDIACSCLRSAKFFAIVCLVTVCCILYLVYYVAVGTRGPWSQPSRTVGKNDDPWFGIPEFILYVRFTSGNRWDQDFRYFVVRTLKLFFPSDRANLVVVLNSEKTEDHYLGENIKSEWPFPKICYSDKGDPSIYHNKGKSRMFWDMFHPDKCTEYPYIGFIDTDTFFSTLITPGLLFEHGKPVIVAYIGKPRYACWSLATEIFLGRKEVLQCMSTFPVMIKNEHMKEMRKRLSFEHEKTFEALFRDAPIQAGGSFCICQFSIMCNYVWYYHRDEYSWHIQVLRKGVLGHKDLVSSMPGLRYYKKALKPNLTVPIPRSSIHVRYLIVDGIKFEQQDPPREIIEGFIRESLCFSAGFQYCAESCRMYQRNKVHKSLFAFEFHDWMWDKRCFHAQQKHYFHVRKFLEYSISNNKGIFGLKSISELCPLIEAHEPYLP